MEHWFWLGLITACLVWYSTVTVYVAVKGIFDIQRMLDRLTQKKESDQVPTL
jgi:hypothetical protein